MDDRGTQAGSNGGTEPSFRWPADAAAAGIKPEDEALQDLAEWCNVGLEFARGFRGQEKQLDEVVAVCEEIDTRVKGQLGIPETTSLTLPDEKIMKGLLRDMGVDLPLTDDIIGVAADTFKECVTALGDRNDRKQLEEMGIVVIKLNGVLLEPDGTRRNMPNGKSTEPFNELKTMPRLEMILSMLQSNKIYTDDIIVGEGDVDPDQMRHLPYYLVEIPRLNRQILICDEVDEQTFVIDGIMNRKTLLKLKKSELQEKYSDRVMPVPCRNKEQYVSDVSLALFFEFSDLETKNPVRPKVKIIDQELIRDEMLKQFPTSKDFFDATFGNARREISILGKKMTAIMGIFGIEGTDNVAVGRLAQKIYGTDDEYVQRYMRTIEMGADKDKWRTAIKNKCPKMSDFIAMGYQDRLDFEIDGKRIYGLVTIFFGAQEVPLSEINLYKLALEVYGSDDPETREKVEMYVKNEEKRLELGTDKSKWSAEMKKLFPTLEDFIEKNRTFRDRLRIEIAGMKITHILRIFDIEEEKSGNFRFYKLAKAIYGSEENPELQAELDRYMTNEENS